jgi:integrating conjugative element protein (TIGR03746 family)
MTRYRCENDNLRAHIATLRAMAGILSLVVLALWYGWFHAKGDLRIHIPPDLRSGAVLRPDDPKPENVYAFARTIFQGINYWPEDGQTDYGKAIFAATYYLTPAFREALNNDLDLRGKAGELAQRVRSVQEIPGHGYDESRVRVLGNGAWVVALDFRVHEFVRGTAVKTVAVSYPIRVSAMRSDPTQNPWGLALDGYDGDGPRRMEPGKPAAPMSPQAGGKP